MHNQPQRHVLFFPATGGPAVLVPESSPLPSSPLPQQNDDVERSLEQPATAEQPRPTMQFLVTVSQIPLPPLPVQPIGVVDPMAVEAVQNAILQGPGGIAALFKHKVGSNVVFVGSTKRVMRIYGLYPDGTWRDMPECQFAVFFCDTIVDIIETLPIWRGNPPKGLIKSYKAHRGGVKTTEMELERVLIAMRKRQWTKYRTDLRALLYRP